MDKSKKENKISRIIGNLNGVINIFKYKWKSEFTSIKIYLQNRNTNNNIHHKEF